MSTMKAAGFDTTFINALGNKNIGGAYGGADFDPYNKSETEIQVRVTWEGGCVRVCVCVCVCEGVKEGVYGCVGVFYNM
jgi:hypothetical protein